MLNESYKDMLFDGVALSELSNDHLLLLRGQLTKVIHDLRERQKYTFCARTNLCCSVCRLRRTNINFKEHELDILDAEYDTRGYN